MAAFAWNGSQISVECTGKGNRGGLRVIYYYLSANHQIWFFTLYDKDEAADLTTEEKKVLKKAIQAELTARRRKQ